MKKQTHRQRRVKQFRLCEAARVTPAAGAAAIGDGGRSLEQLECDELGQGRGRWCGLPADWENDDGQALYRRWWPSPCHGAPCAGCGYPAELCWPRPRRCCPNCSCDRLRCWGPPRWAAPAFYGLRQQLEPEPPPRRAAEPEPVAAAPERGSEPRRLPAPPEHGGGGAGAAGRHGGPAVVALVAQLRGLLADWRSRAAGPERGAENWSDEIVASQAIGACADALEVVIDDFDAERVLAALEQLQAERKLEAARATLRAAEWQRVVQRSSREARCPNCGTKVDACVERQLLGVQSALCCAFCCCIARGRVPR